MKVDRSVSPPAERILAAADKLFYAQGIRAVGGKIAVQFKEQRRLWYRALLERLDARNPDALATQLQILFEGALAAALVRGDPALARSARDAAEVLLAASGVRRPSRRRRRSARRS